MHVCSCYEVFLGANQLPTEQAPTDTELYALPPLNELFQNVNRKLNWYVLGLAPASIGCQKPYV